MSVTIKDIDTPALIIEESIMHHNLRSMQDLVDRRKVSLRAHIKTHKIPELARLQVKLGAVGIAVAKLGEAEVMVRAGIKDIHVANLVVGETKIQRLLRLHRRCRLRGTIDSRVNAEALSDTFAAAGRHLDVLVKVNSGHDRCGVDGFAQLLDLIRHCHELSGIDVIGIMTHAGQVYGVKSQKERRAVGLAEGRLMVDHARRLEKAGYPVREVSVGSTPSAPWCTRAQGVTELRAGNFIFHDMIQVSLGTVPVSRCALNVLATVVSRPSEKRAVLDTGSKALSLDRGAHGKVTVLGHGKIVGTKNFVDRVSEEHGVIENPSGKLQIGRKVRVIPNHACAVMNLFDKAYLVDGDRVVAEYAIAARGKSV